MFSENDMSDTNVNIQYSKPKPQFIEKDNNLVLTGVPVPKVQHWKENEFYEAPRPHYKTKY